MHFIQYLWFVAGLAGLLIAVPTVIALLRTDPLLFLAIAPAGVVLYCLLRVLERALKRAFHPSRVWRDIRRERSRHGR